MQHQHAHDRTMHSRRPVVRSWRVALYLLVASGLACESRPTGRIESMGIEPRLTDRLYALMKQQLTDSAPARLQQAVICENSRIYDAVGFDEGGRREYAMYDSLYRTPADRRARDRVDQSLAMGVFTAGPAACDSLDAISARLVPFTHVAPPDTLDYPRDTATRGQP